MPDLRNKNARKQMQNHLPQLREKNGLQRLVLSYLRTTRKPLMTLFKAGLLERKHARLKQTYALPDLRSRAAKERARFQRSRTPAATGHRFLAIPGRSRKTPGGNETTGRFKKKQKKRSGHGLDDYSDQKRQKNNPSNEPKTR